ncbi:hypothetical protein O3P69_000403 [Scylla paramamosain]|uniref:Ferritin n=2 Tax=Scylla paramamosain TaxID=85552 RepID=A0AAW0UVJ7_SCYPA
MNLWIISGLLLLGVACVPGVGGQSPASNSVDEAGTASEEEVCHLGVVNCTRLQNYPSPVCFNEGCMNAITNHITFEFHAAFKYLYMGAVFGQYIKERPGVAKFFLEAATEERGHGIQMMDYLNMRGFEYNENFRFSKDDLWKINGNHVTDTSDLVSLKIREALQEAVNMEIDVTEKILQVVAKCADDYHAADVFTNPILEEQYTGLRKLQGAIRTYDALIKGNSGNEELAEFIFDKKVLKGEIL